MNGSPALASKIGIDPSAARTLFPTEKETIVKLFASNETEDKKVIYRQKKRTRLRYRTDSSFDTSRRELLGLGIHNTHRSRVDKSFLCTIAQIIKFEFP